MNLKIYRENERVSLRQLAEKCKHCSAMSLQRYENGERMPRDAAIADIEHATDGAVTSVDHFRVWDAARKKARTEGARA